MLMSLELERLLGSLIAIADNFDKKTGNYRYKSDVSLIKNSVNRLLLRTAVEADLVAKLRAYGSAGIQIYYFLNKPLIGTYEDTIAELKRNIEVCKTIQNIKSQHAGLIGKYPSLAALINNPQQLGNAQLMINNLLKKSNPQEGLNEGSK